MPADDATAEPAADPPPDRRVVGAAGRSAGRVDASVSVNGARVRELRVSLGWTQERLAERAGYTPRVVRKMERGGSVRRQTLDDVADALAAGGANLPPGAGRLLTARTPPAELERLCREWCRRAYDERDLSVVDDLMTLAPAGGAPAAAGGPRAAARRRVLALHRALDDLTVTLDRLTLLPDAAEAYWTAEGRWADDASDRLPPRGRTAIGGFSRFRFRNGLIAEVRDYWDVSGLLPASAGGGDAVADRGGRGGGRASRPAGCASAAAGGLWNRRGRP